MHSIMGLLIEPQLEAMEIAKVLLVGPGRREDRHVLRILDDYFTAIAPDIYVSHVFIPRMGGRQPSEFDKASSR